MNNRSQAVRLPKEFQFGCKEVYIRRQGDDIVLSPHPENWSTYFSNEPAASSSFMDDVDDLPVQERNL